MNDEKIIEEFLNKTNFINKKEVTNDFDFSLKAGDAIIFDEGGLHKASRTVYNERLVLRYIYATKKRNIISDLFSRKKSQNFFHHPDKLGKGRPILPT